MCCYIFSCQNNFAYYDHKKCHHFRAEHGRFKSDHNGFESGESVSNKPGFMSQTLEQSKVNGVHHELARLEGDWEGTSKVWFGPDNLADESPVQGNMRLILGGRFIMHGYRGSFKGDALEGLAIFGYHLGLGIFQATWIDSFHNGTAMMFSEGERNSQSMKMLGHYHYVTPELEQKWGWRTEINIVSDNNIIITAYNITPEGEETLATETNYVRVK
jgi:hypothetical protein